MGRKIFKKIFFIWIFLGLATLNLIYAEEITILYTGSTESYIYPFMYAFSKAKLSSEKKSIVGGISRRATLINQIRAKNPNILLLDAGSSFAKKEESAETLELSKLRTRLNIQAMKIMQYDAVNIGINEFNFGEEFLIDNIKSSDISFISCNLFDQQAIFKPYIIKEIAGVRFGIIGLTNLSVMDKIQNIRIQDPEISLRNVVNQIRDKVDFIIVLSSLGEYNDRELVRKIGGIDIIINGGVREGKDSFLEIGNTLLLRCSMRGAHLGKLTLNIKNKNIKSFKVEELLLSEKIEDDSKIVSLLPLPKCIADKDCVKEGMVGLCEKAGTPQAQCLFKEVNRVKLKVIIPKICRVCDPQPLINFLKNNFSNLEVSYLYYPSKETEILLQQLEATFLPVYLLDRAVEKENKFLELKNYLKLVNDYYIILPEFAGMSYLLNRTPIIGKLDLFISLFDNVTAELLEVIREFRPEIHFLAIRNPQGKFEAQKGDLEVEEYLRGVCVKKYYPQYFWDYISCRAKNIYSCWWDDCLNENMDYNKIKDCAKSKEAEMLLDDNIRLNKELNILFGPTYLLDNYEIFSSKGRPSKEEIRNLIKGKK